jgi:hypothetical protein
MNGYEKVNTFVEGNFGEAFPVQNDLFQRRTRQLRFNDVHPCSSLVHSRFDAEAAIQPTSTACHPSGPSLRFPGIDVDRREDGPADWTVCVLVDPLP